MCARDTEQTRAPRAGLRRDTRGSMTIFGMSFFLLAGIIGAIAVDISALYATRTHLQIAADQAAHAALYNVTTIGNDPEEAKQAAIDMVAATLPLARHGITIAPEDITFGTYDPLTGVFVGTEIGVTAAYARTSLTQAKQNAAPSFLFRLLRIDGFDVDADSIFTTYTPPCLTDGFVANGTVDMQNQNFFGSGTCVHSNAQAELQINNTFESAATAFETGAILSMPGGAQTVVVPGDRLEDVAGLTQALRDAALDLRVLTRIENMIHQYQHPDSTTLPHPAVAGDAIRHPSYISDTTVRHLGAISEVLSTALIPGNVYFADCTNANKGLTIRGGSGPLSLLPAVTEVVLITPCPVTFAQGTLIENARIITLSDDASSMTASSGLTLGALGLDGCEENGVQLITRGGIRFAADFAAYGSQVFAIGDITFASTPSAPSDFKGVSFVAGGEIDLASHVSLRAGCATDLPANAISATYLRMAR